MSQSSVLERVLEIARRRGFFWPAYETYGGSAGLFVFGDAGVKMRQRIESIWREMMVRPHDFLEIDGPEVVPEQVLQASGHVANFKDPLAVCKSCQRKFRADHLLSDRGIRVVEGAPIQLIAEKLAGVDCPECGSHEWDVKPFLTMFQTSLGPYSEALGYLRPETAQNIFVEFKRIFEVGREKMPMGVAQVGRGFRNEISPRQSLVRMREFHMAELELFFDPDEPSCEFIKLVEDEELNLLAEETLEAQKEDVTSVTVKEALAKGLVRTEWLAYFMALSKLFIARLGVPPEKQRFRAKLKGERAHYSAQTFDHEVYIEGLGWLEVAGHAYRTDYDLSAHMKMTGADYSVSVQLPNPKRVVKKVWSLDIEAAKKKYGDSWKRLVRAYSALKEDDRAADPPDQLGGVKLDSSTIRVQLKEKVLASKKFVPHVVEPSFGLDRITLAVLVHAYSAKDGRVVMRIPRQVAPADVGVFPLLSRPDMVAKAQEIRLLLESHGLVTIYDESASIGRRYARIDEIGVPLAVTVDHDTLEKGTVTLRDRDTWLQDTVKVDDLGKKVKEKLGIT